MFDITDAECRKHDPSWWDPGNGIVRHQVVRICAMCPIAETCLQWGIENDEHGIWGGLTREQRQQLRRGRARAKCPICKASTLWNGDDEQTCGYCGTGWNVRRKTAELVR